MADQRKEAEHLAEECHKVQGTAHLGKYSIPNGRRYLFRLGFTSVVWN